MQSNQHKITKVTPTVSSGAAYATTDQVGGIMTLTGAAFDADGAVKLTHLTVLDREAQKANLTLFFFDDLPTVASVDNGNLNITDAELMAKCIGSHAVVAADYADVAGVAMAQKLPNLLLKSSHVDAEGKRSGNLYCVAQNLTTTPTYTSTSSLTFVFGLEA